MTVYNSYALNPELKKLAVRQSRDEPGFDRAWQNAASLHDGFFMRSQKGEEPPASERIAHRKQLIDIFTSIGVWRDEARKIVDECLLGAVKTEVDA